MNPLIFIIRGASVCDGTGREPVSADIVLRGDRIADVIPPGSFQNEPDAEIDAHGLTAVPGFIDIHAHSDLTLVAAPDGFSKLSQGVTSEISGNCGSSQFPVSGFNFSKLASAAEKLHLNMTWSGFQDYCDMMQKRRPAINFGYLCGHGTLRAAVMGCTHEKASPDQIQKMTDLLRTALQQGAFGLSTGLIYVPGKFADHAELAALMRVLHQFDAVYATHMRSEGDTILEAVEEAVSLAQDAAVRLEISHLKTAFPRNWGKLPEVFRRIEAARAAGMSVTADRYPYTFSQTSLDIILPAPYDAMTDRAIQDTLAQDDSACRDVHAFLERREDWSGVLLTYTSLPEYRDCLGISIRDAASRAGMTPADLLTDIFRRDASRAMGAFGGLSPENMEAIIRKPYVCCGTDENARPVDESIGRSHPRGFGSFPKFLNIAAKTLGFPEAIRKVTDLPARTFGIWHRGRLLPGWFADIVLLDPAELRDTATFASPHSPASGIRAVFVNGILAYTPDRTEILHAGRLLTPHRD